MRLIGILLTLTITLLARDNFIFESYKPGEVETKINKLEKEIYTLKKHIMKLEKSKKQKPVKTKVETKTIIVDKDTKENIKNLKVIIWNLQQKVKKLSSSKNGSIHKGLMASNKELKKKITALEKKIARMTSVKSKKSSNHDSMRIDILDDKISQLERSISMIQNKPKTSPTAMSMASLGTIGFDFKDQVTQYFLLVIAAVFILLFAMASIAMSRSKDALVAVKKFSQIMKRKS